MQCDELATQKVLAWRNAFGDGDGLYTFVGDKAVDAPFGAVEGIFGNLMQTGESCSGLSHFEGMLYLEPAASNPGICFGVTDFLEVGHHRALVATVNDLARPGGQSVSPCKGCG